MIISFKMIDGLRIDVPMESEREDEVINNLYSNGDCVWCEVYEDENKRIILRLNNIVSITIHKGDGDDS